MRLSKHADRCELVADLRVYVQAKAPKTRSTINFHLQRLAKGLKRR